ncbi:hypothetical protein [Croceicoccus sp. YJ47]|uniref:hypothetical protein n=1 Tax=Croceicoccus sp. YJ47 TaxID=2798724 RepID=UPI001F2751B5|nr:hypothetical protein [Croceicoccus sp. YJ47]
MTDERKSIMKRTALALILATGLTATPAMAQEQHDHGAQAAAQQQDHASHMMQDSEAMTAHREKMAEMRALMQQARAASDPAERQRLMAEHRTAMQEHMAGMMQGDNSDLMAACHQRMMMHDMMEQMAAHENIAQDD